MCIELGLHRREVHADLPEDEKEQAVLVFWSVYVLDRRWSFGTGMPFALQDADIDQGLQRPEGRSPYLHAMIDFSTIAAQVWQSVNAISTAGNAPIDTQLLEQLDKRLRTWHKNVPEHLYFDSTKIQPGAPPPVQHSTRAGRRLPLLLYLRRNSMRISIYRPILHSATSIIAHRSEAKKVVNIAKDTIRVLTHIRQTSNLYETQQMLFNAFLTAALAVLFLAVAHTPAEFADQVREEYYLGIEIVRNLSKDSYIGKRLWRTVKLLNEVAPKLGLTSKESEHDRRSAQHGKLSEMDPNRTAAVAMAGLAGHPIDEAALYRGGGTTAQSWPSEMGKSTSPDAVANNLSSLFEAAGSYTIGGSAAAGQADQFGTYAQSIGGRSAGAHDGMDLGWGIGSEEMSNILKDLF